MLSWLAAWLQQIIAVVLLAGFIDLLLPNKAMQRYVRLVAGLLILLTILTPIIRLLQGDFTTKLDERLSGWLQSGAPSEARMPTLQDIQRDAETLRLKQQAAAATLTERKLAEAMREEITKRTGLDVLEVSVKLDREKESADVSAVTVTLGAINSSGESGSSSSDDSAGMKPEGAAAPDQAVRNAAGNPDAKPDSGEDQVKPVEPVAVAVTVEPEVDRQQGAGMAGDEPYTPAGRGKADAVKQVLRDGWAVDPGAVTVREAADPGGFESTERRE